MAARLEELGDKNTLNQIMKPDGSASDLGTSLNYNGS
jgi:hypothetical protein